MSKSLILSRHRLAALAGAAITAIAAAAPAHAQVIIGEAWVRGIFTSQSRTSVFMTLTSSVDAKLVAARSPVAGRTELHNTVMEDGVMMMRPIPSIDLPARQAVKLEPGGRHIMLIDVNRPIKPLELIPLAIVIESAARGRQTVHLEVPVRRMSQGQNPDSGADASQPAQ